MSRRNTMPCNKNFLLFICLLVTIIWRHRALTVVAWTKKKKNDAVESKAFEDPSPGSTRQRTLLWLWNPILFLLTFLNALNNMDYAITYSLFPAQSIVPERHFSCSTSPSYRPVSSFIQLCQYVLCYFHFQMTTFQLVHPLATTWNYLELTISHNVLKAETITNPAQN